MEVRVRIDFRELIFKKVVSQDHPNDDMTILNMESEMFRE
jgi:hypothetical protein